MNTIRVYTDSQIPCSFNKIGQSLQLLDAKDERVYPCFVYLDGILSYQLSHKKGDWLVYDFFKNYNYFKKSRNKGPLAKALGVLKNKNLTIIDTTCGTGKDAILILYFGAKVVAFERNPITYVLLENARKRFFESVNDFDESDFIINFGQISKDYNLNADVIYFDPMYEDDSKKKALPGKNMQIFSKVVGKDSDAKEYGKFLLTLKAKRVVIKRSARASKLLENVSFSLEGKTTRYDCYIP